MAKINKLKNQARREEQRENWSRAIELYTQALDASRKDSGGFADVSLYNRIGDIYLRIGQKNTAVRYYEQAIELYAEQDLHTSAIALCNKVLRILPDRSTVFLQLGRLNLATNLVAEGREHYHRYATAMRKRGSEEAALESLEELIASTGDSSTLTLWAGWLAEASDAGSALTRIEELRESLERHGIDPDEVAEQVRSKTVVGFEQKGGEAPAADPLAGAFLTLGDDPRSGTGAPVDPSEGDPVSAGAIDAGTAGDDRDEADDPARDALPDESGPQPDEIAAVGADGPAAVERGSIPWEQEVEEIIAEFDLVVEETWADVSPEPEDLAVEPGRVARSRPDPEASEAGTTRTRASARPSQPVEAAEFDEREPAAAQAFLAGAIDFEDDEAPDGATEGIDGERVEREAVEAPVADGEVSWPASADDEEPESLDATGPAREPAGAEGPESVGAAEPERESGDGVDEEPAERASGPVGEPLESGFSTSVDDLESIVQAAAALGDAGGFDAEPVLADESPEVEPEEPSEPDAEWAPFVDPEAAAVPLEPSDVEAPEPEEEDDAAFALEALAESPTAETASDAVEVGSLAMEADEDPAGEDGGWMDEVRETLDGHAHAGEEAAERDLETTGLEPDEPSAGDEEADLEAETIAVEWSPGTAGTQDTESWPEAGAESRPEPVAGPRPEAGPEGSVELEPAATAGRDAGEGVGTPPTNGGPGSRGKRAAPEEEPLAPLAEPRLTVEEDPEDAFRDWVESASTGVLKRALAELANRKEHERALAVIHRLTELEVTDVDVRIRQVEYLQSLNRIPEAVEACLAMARMLESEGRIAEARDAYERTERLDPGEERALEGLARLEGVEDDSQREAVPEVGPKRPYMPDHVNGTDRGSVMDRPMPSVTVPVESRGPGPRPYSGVAGGSEAGTDFEQLLSEFRAELHEKPARSDSSSRTELGARLKEMGRLDDAIRELQGAVREPSAPPLAFELLGEAFLEKGQPRIAVRFLEKALGSLSQGDRDILGVLYQLGVAYESLNDPSKALICYERIFSVDIDYRDIQERILTCSA